jgi:23S rRNA (cytosine1962-C5)-methyltransferase
MKSLFLNKNVSSRVENGHPWIFANEINRGKALDAAAKAGEIVNVFTHDKKFIGKGYVNPQSQIMVRLLTRDKDKEINDDFFYDAILKAWTYRQKLGYVENCRLIFGEADQLR